MKTKTIPLKYSLFQKPLKNYRKDFYYDGKWENGKKKG